MSTPPHSKTLEAKKHTEPRTELDITTFISSKYVLYTKHAERVAFSKKMGITKILLPFPKDSMAEAQNIQVHSSNKGSAGAA